MASCTFEYFVLLVCLLGESFGSYYWFMKNGHWMGLEHTRENLK